MYGSMSVSGLPASGVGAAAYAASGDGWTALVMMLAAFTLLMAAKAVWRMAPAGGEVRDR